MITEKKQECCHVNNQERQNFENGVFSRVKYHRSINRDKEQHWFIEFDRQESMTLFQCSSGIVGEKPIS